MSHDFLSSWKTKWNGKHWHLQSLFTFIAFYFPNKVNGDCGCRSASSFFSDVLRIWTNKMIWYNKVRCGWTISLTSKPIWMLSAGGLKALNLQPVSKHAFGLHQYWTSSHQAVNVFEVFVRFVLLLNLNGLAKPHWVRHCLLLLASLYLDRKRSNTSFALFCYLVSDL